MPIKLAVIGSGIAGLTAAHAAQRHGWRVTLFESQATLGIASHGLRIGETEGANVDVPSRMFNASQWPVLANLYDEIGVECVPIDASQTYSINDEADALLKLSPTLDLATILRLAAGRETRAFALQARRFFQLISSQEREKPTSTFREYLNRGGISDQFLDRFLYPLLSSTVCTCSFEVLDQYPAVILVPAIHRILQGGQLLRTKHGTSDVAKRLTAAIDDTRLSINVHQISSLNDQVVVDFDDEKELFDHVIVATQANTAATLIDSCQLAERELLNRVRYQDVGVYVHSDKSLLPVNRTDWSTFNMLTDNKAAACTVWLNRFYGDQRFDQDVFQTIDVGLQVAPQQVLASARLQRPIVDHETEQTIHELKQMHSQTDRRIWYAGSWAALGVPLLETGVQSAQQIVGRIAEQLNCPVSGR